MKRLFTCLALLLGLTSPLFADETDEWKLRQQQDELREQYDKMRRQHEEQLRQFEERQRRISLGGIDGRARPQKGKAWSPARNI